MSANEAAATLAGRWAGSLLCLGVAACAPPQQQCLSSRDCPGAALCVNGACTGSDGPPSAAPEMAPQPPVATKTVDIPGLEPLCFQPRTPMSVPRGDLMMAEHNGLMYAFGGDTGQITKIVEVYDPACDTWRRVASMPTARRGGAAVTIGDDIHVLGGQADTHGRRVHEVYHPATDTWTQRAAPPIDGAAEARVSAVAVGSDIYMSLTAPGAPWGVYKTRERRWHFEALPVGPTYSLIARPGRIYGVTEGPTLVDYSMADGTWAPRASLLRETHVAQIPSGQLAVRSDQLYYVGGSLRVGGIGTDAQQFFPADARWQYSGALSMPRESFALTESADTIYVAGGFITEEDGYQIPSAALEVSCP